MNTAYFISDTHFGHANCWKKFKKADGSPLRDFNSTGAMNEAIISGWNTVVRPQDTVYHLGDVTMGKDLSILARCNGRKILVLGNHDLCSITEYKKYFHRVAGALAYKSWILTHFPVHPSSLGTRFTHNIHGHLHDATIPDDRYFNVSVERLDYTPISYEQLKDTL